MLGRRGAHRAARVRAVRPGARARSRPQAGPLLRTARAVGTLDALASLAEVAHAARLRPPRGGRRLRARDRGRPPPGAGGARGAPFTPNDMSARSGGRQIMILTGPNMSGKSVFMRQVGAARAHGPDGRASSPPARPGSGWWTASSRAWARRTTWRAGRARSWWRWWRRPASCTTPPRAA